MFLRNDYANITQTLCIRIIYANRFTQALRKFPLLTQLVYAGITQKLRKLNTHSLRILRNITQIIYADITQIIYANHYADYAIITQINYANAITQIPTIALRKLCKCQFLLRRNSGHYAMGNLLMASRSGLSAFGNTISEQARSCL